MIIAKRSSAGLPTGYRHIKADDWGRLGYGVGYAAANTNAGRFTGIAKAKPWKKSWIC